MPTLSTAWMEQFLSTPSARRATIPRYFDKKYEEISIHALREEGDLGNTAALSVTTIFLSTPSARRATHYICTMEDETGISIHALREEGDTLF